MDLYEKYKDDPLIKWVENCYKKAIITLYISLIITLTIFGVTLVLGGLNLISFCWSVLPGFFLILLLSVISLLFEKKPTI